MAYVSNEELFPVWREPRSFWERTGLTPQQQRVLDFALVALVALFIGGWIYSAVIAVDRGEAPTIARRLGTGPSPISPTARPEAAFLLDAALRELADYEDFRGASGAIKVWIRQPGDSLALPDSLPEGVEVAYEPVGAGAEVEEPAEPGTWNLLLRMRRAVRQVPNLNIITLVPATELRKGRIDDYRLGSWPEEVTGVATPETYVPPRGFIRVTPENQNLRVSEHFLLREFLTKGQRDVWPKYVVVSPRMLDKAELTIQELEEMGHPVERVGVISGFRTPTYNESGGNTQGRGALSRHMYGDAVDFFIDNDGDFRMDDLTGDGRVTVADARVMAEAAERVEQEYPHLIGGIGVYAPTGAHAGFIHVDTRGYRARW
jgi:hypothetical protein